MGKTIDRGEASSVALALELGNCFLILDDLRARKMASVLALSFTGTLGVIASAKKRGIIAAARPIFEKIRETDFRFSDAFFAAILIELEE